MHYLIRLPDLSVYSDLIEILPCAPASVFYLKVDTFSKSPDHHQPSHQKWQRHRATSPLRTLGITRVFNTEERETQKGREQRAGGGAWEGEDWEKSAMGEHEMKWVPTTLHAIPGMTDIS